MQPKLLTVVVPIIRLDMIGKCLETFYANTDNIFYFIVIDQSVAGMDMSLREQYKNLMIIRSPKTDLHHTGNLGFTQATNLGLRLAQTPYVMFLNDDCEMIHPAWWDGIMDTFDQVEKATPSRPAMLVNLASVKLPDWSVGRPKGDDFYVLPYKQKYTNEDWRFLVNEDHYVNEHLTITKGSVIDGINLYGSVAITKKLLEVDILDELWYPGGADDYDLCCRASMFGYRCVGTTKAWCFHHWSKSFEDEEQKSILVQDELKHGNLEEKWGYKTDENGEIMRYPEGHDKEGEPMSRFDLWGCRCSKCDEILRTEDGVIARCVKHPEEVYNIPQNTIMPL